MFPENAEVFSSSYFFAWSATCEGAALTWWSFPPPQLWASHDAASSTTECVLTGSYASSTSFQERAYFVRLRICIFRGKSELVTEIHLDSPSDGPQLSRPVMLP